MWSSFATRHGLAPVLLGIGAATAAAHIGNNFTPYLVGGLIDRSGYSPLAMGAWSMTETLAYAAALFGLSRYVTRISPRSLALLSTILVVAAQLGSMLTTDIAILLLLRIVSGGGFGLMNAALNLAASRTERPDRSISAGLALQTLLFAAVNIALPLSGVRYGVDGMFAALAGLSLLFMPALFLLPTAAAELRDRVAASAPLNSKAIRVLLAMALFAFGSLALWPFMERAARAVGLSSLQFGHYQSLATLLSAGSNTALVLFATRLRRSWLTAAALLGTGAACAILTTTDSSTIFGAALVLYNAAWFMTYPMLLGAAFSVDGSGRLSILTSGTWLLLQSLGAISAGAIAQLAGNYIALGPLGLVFCVGALIVIWPVVKGVINIRSDDLGARS